MKVAILGANGLVGSRAFEIWQRHGPFQPCAIVRAPTSLARVARFAGEWKLADARDSAALGAALAGCAAAVHCVTGDERTIAATIDPVYAACRAAKVKRLIFLSSASVHGQNPAPGTDETTPLRDDQVLGYNNAKVRAEARLRKLARDQAVETVVLRPGIVWGPRARWITEAADALGSGRASWIGGGEGICNSIYLDNLVHAIAQAIAVPAARGETYYVGDDERVTWRRFYLGLSEQIGFGERDWTEARPSPPGRRSRLTFGQLKATDAGQALLKVFPSRLKDAVKGALERWNQPPPPNPWRLPSSEGPPVATLEMSLLFACRTRLSDAKARQQLAYRPPVSVAEGLNACGAWLRLFGYAAKGAADPRKPTLNA